MQIISTIDTVGEWGGQEELACKQINKIRAGIAEAITAIAGENEPNQDLMAEAFSRSWNDWGSEEALLTLTDEQIAAYVARIV